jgi:hypothetical protein
MTKLLFAIIGIVALCIVLFISAIYQKAMQLLPYYKRKKWHIEELISFIVIPLGVLFFLLSIIFLVCFFVTL